MLISTFKVIKMKCNIVSKFALSTLINLSLTQLASAQLIKYNPDKTPMAHLIYDYKWQSSPCSQVISCRNDYFFYDTNADKTPDQVSVLLDSRSPENLYRTPYPPTQQTDLKELINNHYYPSEFYELINSKKYASNLYNQTLKQIKYTKDRNNPFKTNAP
jgi:hypothetical protein